MASSQSLFDKAKDVIPSGVNSPVRYFKPYPFFTKRSNKGHIWTEEGQQLIDCCNGYGALLLGHRHPSVISSVTRQLESGTLYCTPTQNETRLANTIIENYPSIDKVRLLNTGGEATMTAIRLARGYTGNNRIIMFDGCYHGAHDSLLAKLGKTSTIPSSSGVPPQVYGKTTVARYNDIDHISSIFRSHNDIAGVIVEPVAGNMGLVLPTRKFLHSLRKLTREHGAVLIFDEVITGFRLAPGGAQEYFGIKPDITTLGKALGGGFGIAAVGGRRDIMDKLGPTGSIYSASTFAGNPIATSAAISAINFMNKNRNKIYHKLADRTNQLAKFIDDIATDLRIPHQVNQLSSMLQIFFTDVPVSDYTTAMTSDTKKFHKLFSSLLNNGVFVAPSQFEVFFLSLAHTISDMADIQDAYQRSLKDVIR